VAKERKDLAEIIKRLSRKKDWGSKLTRRGGKNKARKRSKDSAKKICLQVGGGGKVLLWRKEKSRGGHPRAKFF